MKKLLLIGFLALAIGIPVLANNYPEGYRDFLLLRGPFFDAGSASTALRSLPGGLLSRQVIKALQQPGAYQIYDTEEGGDDYCQRFTIDQVSTDYSKKYNRGVPRDFDVTFRGVSVDYCDFPFSDMEPGTCPPGVLYSDDPSCNIGKTRPYTLQFSKKGDDLQVFGSEHSQIKIIRRPIEKLCREFAPDCPAGYYDYTPVITRGQLKQENSLFIYTAPWKSSMNDLRGVSYFLTTQRLPDKILKYIYEGPKHNLNAWGTGTATYAQCLSDITTAGGNARYDFCIKHEGKNFVMASRRPLGTTLTMWVDEHFRR